MNYHESWQPFMENYDFNVDKLYKKRTTYPPKNQVFRVFQMPVNEIEIFILGQDPYHGYGQANGLSFSVNRNIPPPPTLKNIFKELVLEFPERKYSFEHGCLDRWFEEEHIFLLNSALTVEANSPGSHLHIWQDFTDDLIKFISEHNDKCIFLLLGNPAKAKSVFIRDKNRIVSARHPSPLAQGFIGSNVFKQIEEKLEREINWNI